MHGMKRKYDEDDDTASVDELQATLLNTCISKLSSVMTNGSRRRRTLHHAVLINNMLRSLERVSKPQNVEQHRARITARRHSADAHPSTTKSTSSDSAPLTSASPGQSEVNDHQQHQSAPSSRKNKQSPEHLSSREQKQQLELFSSPWKPQHQLELLPSSVDMDNNEVMSSPTATYCPLLAVDLTLGTIAPVSDMETSVSTLELEIPDISCDESCLEHPDLNFFEPLLFCKTAATSNSFSLSDLSGFGDVCNSKETVGLTQ